jgi:hypothetical protein
MPDANTNKTLCVCDPPPIDMILFVSLREKWKCAGVTLSRAANNRETKGEERKRRPLLEAGKRRKRERETGVRTARSQDAGGS